MQKASVKVSIKNPEHFLRPCFVADFVRRVTAAAWKLERTDVSEENIVRTSAERRAGSFALQNCLRPNLQGSFF